RVLGYRPEELESRALVDLVHPDDRTALLAFLAGAVRDDDTGPGLPELRARHPRDFWLSVETLATNLLHDRNVRGIVLNTRDVSERRAYEEQMTHQVFHDPVTGLANRALFKDRVEHALERRRRDETALAVLLMDL